MNSHSIESIAITSDTVALRPARGPKSLPPIAARAPDWQAASDAFAADFFRTLDAEPGMGAWWAL